MYLKKQIHQVSVSESEPARQTFPALAQLPSPQHTHTFTQSYTHTHIHAHTLVSPSIPNRYAISRSLRVRLAKQKSYSKETSLAVLETNTTCLTGPWTGWLAFYTMVPASNDGLLGFWVIKIECGDGIKQIYVWHSSIITNVRTLIRGRRSCFLRKELAVWAFPSTE